MAMGHSEAEAADEAAMVMSQMAFAQGGAGKNAAAAERLKQIVRSRCTSACDGKCRIKYRIKSSSRVIVGGLLWDLIKIDS